eukprot:GDKH01016587.1.p1 GENE.GDKH01016587.1~~GDKH01016587.1.p1  ORF type:complete len:51 (-),score=1.09 GDKH01016587.1:134-286(-)
MMKTKLIAMYFSLVIFRGDNQGERKQEPKLERIFHIEMDSSTTILKFARM